MYCLTLGAFQLGEGLGVAGKKCNEIKTHGQSERETHAHTHGERQRG